MTVAKSAARLARPEGINMGEIDERTPGEDISEAEMEALNASGLKQQRRYGDAVFTLMGVALKNNPRKCDSLHADYQNMKAQGIPAKFEQKTRCVALYVRSR